MRHRHIGPEALLMSVALLGVLATRGTAACTGDCNADGAVSVNELIVGVNIALGSATVSTCAVFDTDGSGDVTVNELIAAVNNALNGCPLMPTPTPVPGICGNGVVDFDRGETCDDGNTLEGDACPANCRIASCTATGSTLDVDVSFMPPPGADLAGISVFLRYPDGVVRIPGMANDSSVQDSLTNLPDNGFSTPNDLDYALRLVVFTPDSSAIPPGRLVTIRFDTCLGAAPAQATDFHCSVESAANTNNAAVTGAICSVTLP